MRLAILLGSYLFGSCLLAQESRITNQIDGSQRVTLVGHIHSRARAEDDRGRVSPSLSVTYVTLMLAQTDSQKADLNRLLADQQNPGSSNYHRWLTPEEYAGRFGVSNDDLNKIVTWLEAQGLKITTLARSRSWLAFDGTAAQIETAFQTEIHQYLVDGETHYANSAEPSIPAAFAGVVRGIRGLNDFRLKPARRAKLQPDYTSSRGNHYLAPNDLATIYNMSQLYTAGIDGSGQTLVVAGQTQINLSDIAQFRSRFNLPVNDPHVMLIPNSRNPGISSGDLPEADLDLEWSGAVARNAMVIYVYSTDVMTSVQYAIDQNLAPVVSKRLAKPGGHQA